MRLARLRSFPRDRRGATALEFAIVITPFLFMIFAVIEYSLALFLSVTLDTASSTVTREVRTGQAQTASVTAAQYKTKVCQEISWIPQATCEGNMDVDARVFSQFSSASDPTLTGAGGTIDRSKLKFDLGGPCDIIMITSFYKWKLITSVLHGGLSSPMYGTGYYGATARSVFRNEPFGASSC